MLLKHSVDINNDSFLSWLIQRRCEHDAIVTQLGVRELSRFDSAEFDDDMYPFQLIRNLCCYLTVILVFQRTDYFDTMTTTHNAGFIHNL